MLTQQEQKQQRKAVQLVVDYYKYFLNLNSVRGADVINPYRWNRDSRTYEYLPVKIVIRKYKQKNRKQEAMKLSSLITMSPDLGVDVVENKYHYEYNVRYVNLKLPSIANNTLGLERDV